MSGVGPVRDEDYEVWRAPVRGDLEPAHRSLQYRGRSHLPGSMVPGIIRSLGVVERTGGMGVVFLPPTPARPPLVGRASGRAEEQEPTQVADALQDQQHGFHPFRVRIVTRRTTRPEGLQSGNISSCGMVRATPEALHIASPPFTSRTWPVMKPVAGEAR